MEYLLSEGEYRQLTSRPTTFQYCELVEALEELIEHTEYRKECAETLEKAKVVLKRAKGECHPQTSEGGNT